MFSSPSRAQTASVKMRSRFECLCVCLFQFQSEWMKTISVRHQIRTSYLEGKHTFCTVQCPCSVVKTARKFSSIFLAFFLPVFIGNVLRSAVSIFLFLSMVLSQFSLAFDSQKVSLMFMSGPPSLALSSGCLSDWKLDISISGGCVQNADLIRRVVKESKQKRNENGKRV